MPKNNKETPSHKIIKDWTLPVYFHFHYYPSGDLNPRMLGTHVKWMKRFNEWNEWFAKNILKSRNENIKLL